MRLKINYLKYPMTFVWIWRHEKRNTESVVCGKEKTFGIKYFLSNVLLFSSLIRIFLRWFSFPLDLPCFPAIIQQGLLKYIDTYELFNILDLTLLQFI